MNWLRGFVKIIANYFFPLLTVDSLQKFISVNVLFPRNVILDKIKIFYLYFCYISLLLSIFNIEKLSSYLPLGNKYLGLFGEVMQYIYLFGLVEFMIIRTWLLYLNFKNDPKNIPFIKVINQLDDVSMKKLVSFSKSIFIQLYLGGYLMIEFLQLSKLYYKIGADLNENLIMITWSLSHLVFIRLAVNDTVIMYITVVAGFKVIDDKINKLFQNIENSILLPTSFRRDYYEVIESIGQLNTLVKVLMLTSQMLLIPLFTSTIYIAINPVDGLLLNIMRIVGILNSSVYASRGYLMTAFLSKVETQSKILYKKLMTQIARREQTDTKPYYLLITVIEDLSCRFNKFSLREFDGKLTQSDALQSVTATASLIMLLYQFQTSFGFF